MIAKGFDILATSTSYYNYFDDLNKIFLDLYLAKFSDTSTRSFFSCKYKKIYLYKWKFTLV